MKVLKLFITLTVAISTVKSYSIISSDINYLKNFPDIKRNLSNLKGLDIKLIGFKEGKYKWKMFLITNKGRPKGPFWFLPHDNENSAFDSAIYAIKRYGGGLLSIYSGGRRYYLDQDPNRNFSLTRNKVKSCKFQKAPSQIYTSTIMEIIDRHRPHKMPYLAIHNNSNGLPLSILKSSKYTKSYLAYPKSEVIKGIGLADEDNLVYIAGKAPYPPQDKLDRLLNIGLNVKYEEVNRNNNDCSFSNFITLNYKNDYYNIETQHNRKTIQKDMIDRLLKVINR